jgi:hypothetical protein
VIDWSVSEKALRDEDMTCFQMAGYSILMEREDGMEEGSWN